MTSTTKYQLSLPFVLLPASPSLAALHATRARILHPTESAFLDSTHCVKCGSYFDDEIQPVKRRKAFKGEGYIRVMTKICRSCGFCYEIPIDGGNASSFPRTRKARASISVPAPLSERVLTKPQILVVETAFNQQRSPSVASSNPQTPYPSHPPTASSSKPPVPARSKTRPKKKPGLQDMLSRNKQKEAKAREAKNEGQGGLAAFLSGL